MSKKDKPPYKFIFDGRGLVPEMEFDRQALAGLHVGQGVKVEIGQWRNLDRLRAYWATLNDCDEPEMIAFFLAVEERLAKDFGFVSERKLAA